MWGREEPTTLVGRESYHACEDDIILAQRDGARLEGEDLGA